MRKFNILMIVSLASTLIFIILFVQESNKNEKLAEIVNENAYGDFFSSISMLKELENSMNQWIMNKSITLTDLDIYSSSFLQDIVKKFDDLLYVFNKMNTKKLTQPIEFQRNLKDLHHFLYARKQQEKNEKILLNSDEIGYLTNIKTKLHSINKITNDLFPEEYIQRIQDVGFYNDSRWQKWFGKSEEVWINGSK